MKNTRKSATCCYCGTHTILTLGDKATGRARHELKCGTCGAPISSMKSIRKDHVEDPFTVQGKRGQKPAHASKYGSSKHGKDSRRKKPKKSFAKRFFDIAEDVIDLFD